jgi:hypothetical protein
VPCAAHLPVLTVRETFEFARMCQQTSAEDFSAVREVKKLQNTGSKVHSARAAACPCLPVGCAVGNNLGQGHDCRLWHRHAAKLAQRSVLLTDHMLKYPTRSRVF